ncbi:hypothetical protein GF312_00480 [Candidatus Poribacteria bacterium]|nr:hypothetical protein [Candidatus Poribacteria bacterium]
MNLSIITTIGINAGDNFIYEGFKKLFPVKKYGSILLINKADVPRSKEYRELIDLSDIIVICGSPIFYKECYKMKWQNRILDYSKKSGKKILLFAVGSNFLCSADGKVKPPVETRDGRYRKFVSRYNEAIIDGFNVRDRYCRNFLNGLGFQNVNQVSCPSLFSGDMRIKDNDADLIFLIWGDDYWSCKLSPKKILKICHEIKAILEKEFSQQKVVWVCHDFNSYKRLLKKVKNQEVLFSNNYIDFFKYYKRCRFAFSVKVHGSMLLSSMGIPSLLLQLDSRASVIEALDETYAVPAMETEEIAEMCLQKFDNKGEFRDKINYLKDKYKKEYNHLFEKLGFI